MASDKVNNHAELFKTIDFACKKHKDQRRKDPDQTPYINHPIGVANTIVNEGGVSDLEVLQAAVLHDTVEDTDTSFEELEELFGKKVTDIVREVSDDKTLNKEARKQAQIDHAGSKSKEGKIVGMADKIYNLRDLTRVLPMGWTEERRAEYFRWAERVCVQYYDANEKLAEILKKMFSDWKA